MNRQIAEPAVLSSLEEDGSLLHLTLNRPKGNILDRAMIGELQAAVDDLSAQPKVRSILLTGAGSHFSFGASVEEHLPEEVEDMLAAFHQLLRDLVTSGRVLLAAVRGQCLGGGLELVSICQRVFASPEARLGQPEIKLGVFAPIGSVVLPIRIGQPAADLLLLTGKSLVVEEALQVGLIDELHADPVQAAMAWHRQHLSTLSAAALRHAVRASRTRLERALLEDLPRVERRYLDELMQTHDGREGITAFLEKRQPVWTHH